MNTQKLAAPTIRRISAAEFLETSPLYLKSKMIPFWNDIKTLRKAGQEFQQIVVFLAANGVTVTMPGVQQYYQRRIKKEEGEAAGVAQ